MHILFAIHNY